MRARWEEGIGSRVLDDGVGAGGEFRETIGSLKGICVRSFPEVLVDVRSAALGSGPGLGPSGGVGTSNPSVGTSVASITRQVSSASLLFP